MIEKIAGEFWKVTSKLRAMIAMIPVVLYRGNKAMHVGIRKTIGEGITSLFSTVMILVISSFIYLVFFSGYKITISDAITAAKVDAKIAYHTKKAGLW